MVSARYPLTNLSPYPKNSPSPAANPTIVAVAPSDSNRVYAQFAAGYVSGFTYYRGRYIAQSQDGGLTWTPVPKPDDSWSTLAWHAFILQVDPTDPDMIFTGGLDLWKSDNAGNVWRHVSDWSLMYWGGGDAYVHADQHNIQYKPDNPNTAIYSSDGGVFLTNTSNLNYPVFNERNQGYNTLQFYTCAIHPNAGTNYFIGGLQDNGTVKGNANNLNNWTHMYGGDGFQVVFDRLDTTIVYVETQNGGLAYLQYGMSMGYFDSGIHQADSRSWDMPFINDKSNNF